MKISDFLSKENNNLDLMRIILACLVIIGHAEILNGSDGFWIDPIAHFFKFTYAGSLAVKVFLFISGLVVTNSLLAKRSIVYFAISRFFRIMPALLFVLLLTVFIFGPIVTELDLKEYFSELNYLAYIRHNIVFFTDYLLPGVFNNNLYPNIVNGSFWTLRYEIGCYLLLPILFFLFARKNKNFILIPILLIFIDTVMPNKILLAFIDDNPEKYLLPLSFSCGVFLAVFSEKIHINIYTVLILSLLYFVFRNTNYAEILLMFVSFAIVIFVAAQKSVLIIRPKYDVSYGIYLWGFLIQQLIFYFLGHLHIVIHTILAIALSTLFAVVTFVFVEKPFIAYGKSLLKFIANKYPKYNSKLYY